MHYRECKMSLCWETSGVMRLGRLSRAGGWFRLVKAGDFKQGINY